MNNYYARDGSPLSVEEWAESRTAETERVAYDEVTVDGDTYRISTIWLGLNYRFGDGPPLIFETMVFPEDSYSELDMDRYSTEAQALAGHQNMIERVQSGEMTP